MIECVIPTLAREGSQSCQGFAFLCPLYLHQHISHFLTTGICFTHYPGWNPSHCQLPGQCSSFIPHSLSWSLGCEQLQLLKDQFNSKFPESWVFLWVLFICLFVFACCVLLNLSSSSENKNQRAARFSFPKFHLEPVVLSQSTKMRSHCVNKSWWTEWNVERSVLDTTSADDVMKIFYSAGC